MPDPYGPSEFGGKGRRNRTQPPPHFPTASERLMLVYTTGDESGVRGKEGPEVFEGLLPEKEQRAIRKQAGDLDKGQVWAEILAQGANPQ